MDMCDIIITFHSPQGQGILLFSLMSISSVGCTLSPTQGLPAVVFPGIKQQGNEADHSPPSSAEVKNSGVVPLFHA